MHGGWRGRLPQTQVLLHLEGLRPTAEGPIRRAPELKKAGRAGVGKTDPIFDPMPPDMLHLHKMLQPARRSPCRS